MGLKKILQYTFASKKSPKTDFPNFRLEEQQIFITSYDNVIFFEICSLFSIGEHPLMTFNSTTLKYLINEYTRLTIQCFALSFDKS